MSDKDRPLNPFNRGDRTVIRPNPGGRIPQPPAAPPGAPPAAPGAGPAPYAPVPGAPFAAPPGSPYPPPPGAPYPASGVPHPAAPGAPYQPSPVPVQRPPGQPEATPPLPAPPPSYPAQTPAYAGPPTTPSPEDWISTASQPQAPVPTKPEAPALRIDELVAPNANPIMRAAGPLLLLLGRLRVALMRASFASMMEQVADAINFFEKDIRSAGISEQHANTAKYILCATADDIVQHIPTDDRHVWTQYSMLSRFFGERVGGVRFFEILNHQKLDPLANYPVLELQHACLALGFQGMYRTTSGGVPTLQQMQRDLYELLRRVRPRVMRDLSPRWQGQALAINTSRLRVPVWVVGAAAGALLFGLFVTLKLLLSGSAEATAEKTAILHPSTPVSLHRIGPPAPPPPPPVQVAQVQRIRNNIPAQIGDCKITVDQTATQIIIRLCDITFQPGQAVVQDQFKPVATKIGQVVNDETGKIRVVGHTDSNPIKTVRFPSNWHLSVERAKAVAALIKSGMTDAGRVETDGKGADVPIASNATAEGRQRNRRVEVLIERVPD